ncbi:MAG: helix-turn-helix domain-containing protein [Thermodesulfobacteriota bacterium]|nr:helix-turn-helix domain-containing protein [Thermodesulfobacteriota bacterium]
MDHNKNIPQNSDLLLSCQFNDIDHFLEYIKPYLDTDAVQLEAGPVQINSQFFMMDGVAISRYGTTKKMFEKFCLPGGSSIISFTPPGIGCVCCGLATPPDYVGIIHSGMEYSSLLLAGFDTVEVTVSNNLLAEYGLTSEDRWHKTKIPEQAAFPLPNRRSIRFRNLLYSLFTNQSMLELVQKDRELTVCFREWVIEESLAIVSTCLTADEPSLRIKKKSRHDIFQNAIRLIDDQLGDSLSTRQLAIKLHSSPRVLQYAFKENLGMTPLQYILIRKLHAARIAIKNDFPGGQASISDIATLYNMSHFGRFSLQYKRLFGESPSTTVKRTSPRHDQT